MVWVVEKKVVKHILDMGYERVEIPVRIKFEFEVKEGSLVPESMRIHTLYNKHVLEKRYPQLKSEEFDHAIDTTVRKRIHRYLFECGYISEDH